MRAALLAVLLLFATSCKDAGVERHKVAREKYTECASRGLGPSDPCFDEVVTLLETIPKSSSARPRADVLRDALLTARQPRIRTPLAVQGSAHLPSDVVLQLQLGQKLAGELGTTPEADRPAKLRELDGCRAKAEKIDHAHEHDEHDPGAH